MLANLIGLSPWVRLFGEGDPKYFKTDGTRQLRPHEELTALLTRERSHFTLLKPLCESQRVRQLLDNFPDSRAIWIFRQYRDCIASHLNYYRQYHDAVDYVTEMLHTERPCWKNENLSREIASYLRSFLQRRLNPSTAYALYWLARNSHYFSAAGDPRLRLANYDRIIDAPRCEAEDIFDFCKVPFRKSFVGAIRQMPKTTKHLDIDEDVVEKCEDMQRQLLDAVTLNLAAGRA
jgi:hypothetical protein